MKSGIVSIVGRPNVGKSTLLNALLEMHLAITSDKAQTTRVNIEGIYHDEEAQIVFVDTPGIHKPQNKLGNLLNRKSYQAFQTDVILFVIDGAKGFGRGDQFILDRMKDAKVPILLVINKIDLMKKEDILTELSKLQHDFPFQEMIPISAKEEDNIERLLKVLKQYLPHEGLLIETDEVTNLSTKFYVSEIVREKVLRSTREEVPHAVTCLTESLTEEDNLVSIRVLIIVDRDSLKKILIGKNGSMLKEIGKQARIDLEDYFGKKVYLETFVKTLRNWRDQTKYLKELGLEEE